MPGIFFEVKTLKHEKRVQKLYGKKCEKIRKLKYKAIRKTL